MRDAGDPAREGRCGRRRAALGGRATAGRAAHRVAAARRVHGARRRSGRRGGVGRDARRPPGVRGAGARGWRGHDDRARRAGVTRPTGGKERLVAGAAPARPRGLPPARRALRARRAGARRHRGGTAGAVVAPGGRGRRVPRGRRGRLLRPVHRPGYLRRAAGCRAARGYAHRSAGPAGGRPAAPGGPRPLRARAAPGVPGQVGGRAAHRPRCRVAGVDQPGRRAAGAPPPTRGSCRGSDRQLRAGARPVRSPYSAAAALVTTSGVDPALFRQLLGRFATGVTVVTARRADGARVGMTASSIASVSLEPPLLLVSIDRRNEMHGALQAATRFVVNVLAADQEAISRRFADAAEHRFDQEEAIGYRDTAEGLPVLDGVLAHIECTKTQAVPAGDHTVFFGLVTGGTVTDRRPLLYYRGGYTSLAGS